MAKQSVVVIGIDIGGTNIEAGLVGDAHQVLERAKTATPTEGPAAVLDAVAELVTALGGEPAALGVGFPGVVHEGRVLSVPNLQNWHERVDLGAGLRDRTGLEVALGNDANVGLLGEWLAGAASGVDHVLGVWMGTGIGGGLILDGRPYRGARGAAGEIGHVVVASGGALCTCGRRGCVEAYAGRRSMAGVVSAMVDAGRRTSLHRIQEEEGKTRLTSRVWARALGEGDELTHELFTLAVDMVGVGIGSVVNVLDLEMVVIGGGLAEKLGQHLADRIAEAARPWMLQPDPDLRFVAAALGDDSGLVGAAALARSLVISG